MRKNKIVVTGGAGFIGREMVKKLVENEYGVVCFDLAEQFGRHREFFDELQTGGGLRLVAGSILDRTMVRALSHRPCGLTFQIGR